MLEKQPWEARQPPPWWAAQLQTWEVGLREDLWRPGAPRPTLVAQRRADPLLAAKLALPVFCTIPTPAVWIPQLRAASIMVARTRPAVACLMRKDAIVCNAWETTWSVPPGGVVSAIRAGNGGANTWQRAVALLMHAQRIPGHSQTNVAAAAKRASAIAPSTLTACPDPTLPHPVQLLNKARCARTQVLPCDTRTRSVEDAVCDPNEIRTRVHGLKGHCPRPD